MPTPAQIANALITFFCQEHKRVLGTDLQVNRYTAKWGFQDILQDLGEAQTREIIVFFFKTNRQKYDVQSFLNVYDVLNKNYKKMLEDRRKREVIRERTKRLVEEAEAKNGEARGSTD